MSDERLGAPGTGVVITGGASGIGLAAAHALAEVGRPVALWDINAEGVKAAAADIAARHGVATIGLVVDLRNPQAVAPAAAQTREALGSVGGIVHGAGTALQTGIGGVTPENFDAGMALHVRAVIELVQAFREDLKAHAGGSVVAISSINAWFGSGMIPIYTAAKGAVISLVRSMADELALDGIRINALSPGMIDTPILGEMRDGMAQLYGPRIFIGRFGKSEEIASVIRFLLSNEASYITAAEIVVDGGIRHSQRP
ncbi:SDR family NAD(P)-dependent oxidoreductase [Novosphingobium taihuense]|uniref:NAD(P)-dependent dehydrogenase (Short-subunit alcohol dehydrogenase family) n=1 Tax=Novosphingobium taihuense TaxID=260085 RepID=A0A7W7ABM6_9SPHN|nr:SDR family oxidoreductase [Novosphingobium taihuense]MBB4613961.1 NAD(P)-dependent dehydrogenase (short-subunit alcohol dehydrogenase family) [Novosphingobium taihuense]